MASHESEDWGDSLNQRCGGGKGLTMVMMFMGVLCRCSTEFSYYSYSTNTSVRELFVPARTQIKEGYSCSSNLWMGAGGAYVLRLARESILVE